MSRPTIHIIYAVDPLCGWCYGFGPQLRKLRDDLGELTHFRLLCGGFITGERERPIREAASSLLRSIRLVEHRTHLRFGEAFTQGLLTEGSWVQRSEPPCRAVLLVQKLWPELALDFVQALSSAFFQEGLRPDAPEVLGKVARGVGVPEDSLLSHWETDEARRETAQAFESARKLGIETYPSLYLEAPRGLKRISEGYLESDRILERLDKLGALPSQA